MSLVATTRVDFNCCLSFIIVTWKTTKSLRFPTTYSVGLQRWQLCMCYATIALWNWFLWAFELLSVLFFCHLHVFVFCVLNLLTFQSNTTNHTETNSNPKTKKTKNAHNYFCNIEMIDFALFVLIVATRELILIVVFPSS